MSNERRRRVMLTPEERFWFSVAKSEGCWEWTGARLTTGYGCLGVGGGQVSAHRYSYVLHNGPIPSGLHVLHQCDNRTCVRPDHLFLGTHKDNMEDRSSKGRQAHGVQMPFAKLSKEKAIAIRELCRRWPTSWSNKSGVIAFLARWFEVDRNAIRLVVAGKTWRNT